MVPQEKIKEEMEKVLAQQLHMLYDRFKKKAKDLPKRLTIFEAFSIVTFFMSVGTGVGTAVPLIGNGFAFLIGVGVGIILTAVMIVRDYWQKQKFKYIIHLANRMSALPEDNLELIFRSAAKQIIDNELDQGKKLEKLNLYRLSRHAVAGLKAETSFEEVKEPLEALIEGAKDRRRYRLKWWLIFFIKSISKKGNQDRKLNKFKQEYQEASTKHPELLEKRDELIASTLNLSDMEAGMKTPHSEDEKKSPHDSTQKEVTQLKVYQTGTGLTIFSTNPQGQGEVQRPERAQSPEPDKNDPTELPKVVVEVGSGTTPSPVTISVSVPQ